MKKSSGLFTFMTIYTQCLYTRIMRAYKNYAKTLGQRGTLLNYTTIGSNTL